MGLIQDARQIYTENGILELCIRVVLFLSRSVKENYYVFRYTIIGKPILEMDTPAGKIEFEVSEDYPLLTDIASGDTYEPLLLQELESLLSDDDIFYDVGSCWGIFSLFGVQHGIPPSNIHSFEADTGRYEILSQNLPQKMHINQVFVGDSDDDDRIRLDTYTKNYSPPTVMKIDIEGAELSLIRGAEDLLSELKPRLYIEIHPNKLNEIGDSQEEIVHQLEYYGYTVSVALDHREHGKWVAVSEATLPKTGDYLLRAT